MRQQSVLWIVSGLCATRGGYIFPRTNYHQTASGVGRDSTQHVQGSCRLCQALIGSTACQHVEHARKGGGRTLSSISKQYTPLA